MINNGNKFLPISTSKVSNDLKKSTNSDEAYIMDYSYQDDNTSQSTSLTIKTLYNFALYTETTYQSNRNSANSNISIEGYSGIMEDSASALVSAANSMDVLAPNILKTPDGKFAVTLDGNKIDEWQTYDFDSEQYGKVKVSFKIMNKPEYGGYLVKYTVSSSNKIAQ